MIKKKIGVIGCGNMGSALVENLRKRSAALEIFVFDKDQEKQNSLVKGFKVQPSVAIQTLVSFCDVIIIAVKPQDIDDVLSLLKGISGKLVISIAAGVTISSLESFLTDKVAVVRAMPNLNALIGRSVTALSFNSAVGEEDKNLALEIFQAVGEVVFVKESLMNAVTAISGSGPAFVAYLIKGLGEGALNKIFIQEAEKFGIEHSIALKLANGTVSGTQEMLRVNLDPDILIKRVSSKGGTTEAGMKVLEQKGKTKAALSEAIRAACLRAGELSRRN